MWRGGIVLLRNDRRLSRQVASGLSDVGLGCHEVETVREIAALPAPRPEVIVIGGDAKGELCKRVREQAGLGGVPLLVVVPRLGDDSAPLSAGADDVMRAPASGARLRLRCEALVNLSRAQSELSYHGRGRDLLISAKRIRPSELEGDGLTLFLEDAAHYFGFEWSALLAYAPGSEAAFVIAVSPGSVVSAHSVPLQDAASLREMFHSNQPLYLSKASDPDAPELTLFESSSFAAFPIGNDEHPVGALICGSQSHHDERQVDRDLAAILSLILAGPLGQSRVIERLRDQTRRISRVAYETSRRLQVIEPLRDHFEASSDGVLVLLADGTILFANGTAATLTGFAVDGLIGSKISKLVSEPARAPLSDVVDQVIDGTNVAQFDLDLKTTGGAPICVSVTTSTVLSREGAAVLSFRDVTEQRNLEAELQQTTSFLEKLIDSAVDAIVAADIKGQVLLFNPGAERLFAYRADEVVGKIPVWKLYPEGVAKEIMQKLRSKDGGGVGRVEQTKNTVLSRTGELIPVHMTASMIYEDGREIATFGILSDLREQLRMEERLEKVQSQLEEQERRAMVLQLAGAAAHELNQPLTSIMAYTTWIEKHGSVPEKNGKALSTIMEQAERMADIVKKIGQITKFETKEYVGSAQIIDLDRSSRIEVTPAAPQPIPEAAPAAAEEGAPELVQPQDEVTRPGIRLPVLRESDDPKP